LSSLTLTKHYSVEQIKKHEIVGARSTYGGEVHAESCWGDLRDGDDMEEPGVDGRIILKWFFKKWDGEA
jgi:hypothetical protein